MLKSGYLNSRLKQLKIGRIWGYQCVCTNEGAREREEERKRGKKEKYTIYKKRQPYTQKQDEFREEC